MSRGTALVRFPDGTIKAGIYNGTVDMLAPALFDTVDEAWTAWRAYYNDSGPTVWVDPVGAPEPVEIYSDYGGGMWWRGQATRNAVLHDDCDPWDTRYDSPYEDRPADAVLHERFNGQPRWAAQYLASVRSG